MRNESMSAIGSANRPLDICDRLRSVLFMAAEYLSGLYAVNLNLDRDLPK
jgi:hypothetical protein